MTGLRHPWLISLAAHALAAAALMLLVRVPELPQPVRMHLSAPGSPMAARAAIGVPGAPAKGPAAPGLPRWKEHSTAPGEHGTPTVPVSLDEILGPTPEATEAAAPSGWVSQGYSPPPLPPPELAPPGGADWSLNIAVPAGGGPGTVEGLDSGHPELDRWLETYLRTVSFPAALDGQPYSLHWTLRLVSERPR
jgi:hypothetical protein